MAVISAEIPAASKLLMGTTSQENQKQYFHVTQLKRTVTYTLSDATAVLAKQRETKNNLRNRIIGRLFACFTTGNDARGPKSFHQIDSLSDHVTATIDLQNSIRVARVMYPPQ